jgi:hypothetical protein
MQSVFPTVSIVIIYIIFVIFGQQWMKNKKAFELREFMFVYNFFQVIFCTYITYEVRQKKIKDQFLTKFYFMNRQFMYGFQKDIVYFVNLLIFQKVLQL